MLACLGGDQYEALYESGCRKVTNFVAVEQVARCDLSIEGQEVPIVSKHFHYFLNAATAHDHLLTGLISDFFSSSFKNLESIRR